MAGKPVAAAGEVEVVQGHLVLVNKRSGHYKPEDEHLNQFISELNNQGIDTNSVEIEEGF